MAEGNVVGTASIEITADLTPFEARLADIAKRIEELGTLQVPVTLGGAGSGGPSSGAAPNGGVPRANASADVHIDKSDIRTEIQDALKLGSFQINLNADSIRQSIEKALLAPFTITVKANVEGFSGGGGGGGGGSAVQFTEVPRSRPQASEKLTTAFQKSELKGVVQEVSDFVDGLLSSAGKMPKFGTGSFDGVERLAELMDMFGSSLSKWKGSKGTVSQWLQSQGVEPPPGSVINTIIGEAVHQLGATRGAGQHDVPFMTEFRNELKQLSTAIRDSASQPSVRTAVAPQQPTTVAPAVVAATTTPAAPPHAPGYSREYERARKSVTQDRVRPVALNELLAGLAASRGGVSTAEGGRGPAMEAVDLEGLPTPRSPGGRRSSAVPGPAAPGSLQRQRDEAAARVRNLEGPGLAPAEERPRRPLGEGFVAGGPPGHWLNDALVRGPYNDPKINKSDSASVFHQLDLGPISHEPTSKIHVASTEGEAEKTLAVVDRLAHEMGIAYKWVHDKSQLRGPNPETGMGGGSFGPGGIQQGKFITLYPTAEQARELVQRLAADLEAEGLGKKAEVAPSEKRWGNTPITHRYTSDVSSNSGDERYAEEGGYGPGNPLTPEKKKELSDWKAMQEEANKAATARGAWDKKQQAYVKAIAAVNLIAKGATLTNDEGKPSAPWFTDPETGEAAFTGAPNATLRHLRKGLREMGERPEIPFVPPMPEVPEEVTPARPNFVGEYEPTRPRARGARRRARPVPSAAPFNLAEFEGRRMPIAAEMGPRPEDPEAARKWDDERAKRRREQIESDLEANRLLGGWERANVRRLYDPTKVKGEIAPGLNVDLEPLLQLASRGAFKNIVKDKAGKLHQISPNPPQRMGPEGPYTSIDDLLDADAETRLLMRKKRFTLPNSGIEGQVEPMRPLQVIDYFAKQMLGPNAGNEVVKALQEFLDSDVVTTEVSKAINAGSRAGLPTHGEAGRVSAIRGDADPQRGAQAYVRLQSTVKDLDKAKEKVGETFDAWQEAIDAENDPSKRARAGRLKSTERQYIAALTKFNRLQEQRDALIEQAEPPAVSASTREMREQARDRVHANFGLTEREQLLKYMKTPFQTQPGKEGELSPKSQMLRNLQERGFLPTEEKAVDTFYKQYMDLDENPTVIDSRTGAPETNLQRARRIAGRMDRGKRWGLAGRAVADVETGISEGAIGPDEASMAKEVAREFAATIQGIPNDLAELFKEGTYQADVRERRGAGEGTLARDRGRGDPAVALVADRFTPRSQRAVIDAETAIRQAKMKPTEVDEAMQRLGGEQVKAKERQRRARGEAENAFQQREGYDFRDVDPKDYDVVKDPAYNRKLKASPEMKAANEAAKAEDEALKAQRDELLKVRAEAKKIITGFYDEQRTKQLSLGLEGGPDAQAQPLDALAARRELLARIKSGGAEGIGTSDAVVKEIEQLLENSASAEPLISIGGHEIPRPAARPRRGRAGGPVGIRDERAAPSPWVTGEELGEAFAARSEMTGESTTGALTERRTTARESAANPGGTPPAGPPPRTRSDGMQPGGVVRVWIDGTTGALPVTLREGYAQGGGGEAPGTYADASKQAMGQAKYKRAQTRYALGAEEEKFIQAEIKRLANQGITDPDQQYRILSSSGHRPMVEKLLGDQITRGGAGGSSEEALRKLFKLPPSVQDVSGEEANRVDQRKAELQAEAEAAQRKILRRGFTASVTDVFQAPFFTKQNAAVDRFQRESQQLVRLEEQRAVIDTKLNDRKAILAKAEAAAAAITDTSSKARKRADDRIDKAKNLVADSEAKHKAIVDQISKQEGNVQTAREGLPGRGRAAVNLGIGAGAAGIAFGMGTMVYQAAGMLMGMASQAIEQAAGPAIERALGFGNTAARITRGGAEAISAAGGNVGALTGQMTATMMSAGNYEAMGPIVAARAETQAGNQNLVALRDYMHTAQRLRAEGTTAGPVDRRSLMYSTGGFLDSWLMGIPSTAEILKGEFMPQAEPPTSEKQRIEKQIADLKAGTLPEAAYAEGNEDLLLQLQRDQVYNPSSVPVGAFAPGNEDLRYQISDRPNAAITNLEQALVNASDKIDGLGEVADEGQERLDIFNQQAKKGGEAVLELAYIPKGKAGDDELARQTKMAREAGFGQDYINAMFNNRVGIPAARNAEEFARYHAAVNLGTRTFSPEMILHGPGADWERKARVQLQEAQVARQLDILTPAQFGMQEALAPIETRRGQALSPIRAAMRESPRTGRPNLESIAGNDLTTIQAQIDEVNAAAKEGRQIAIDFVAKTFEGQEALGGSADYADQFATSLNKVAEYGKQINDIQVEISVEQAAYQAHQFELSIYQTNRALRDAKGLISGVGNSLGAVQRQQWNLQRESQSLSMALTQKQIIFQRNIAGFATPGDTPEERAARIQQAQMEARYAQKQLDIQKKLFDLAGKGFRITASRQVIDLTRQLGLLEEGRALTLDTAEAQEQIRALTKMQAKEQKVVETIFGAAVERSNAMMGEAAKLVTATGKDLGRMSQMVVDVYVETYKALIREIDSHAGRTSHPSDSNNRNIDKDDGNAAGYLGMVTGPRSMLVGEAGPETVAILRSPRQVPTGGFGGGGNNVTINITGNTVRNDKDLETLAYLIERKLNQKAALLGYRKPV